jgi:hypothetical protein
MCGSLGVDPDLQTVDLALDRRVVDQTIGFP